MIERWPGRLLLWLEAKRPHLRELVEAIVYEGRSPKWVRRRFGEERWRELVEAVRLYLLLNPYS